MSSAVDLDKIWHEDAVNAPYHYEVDELAVLNPYAYKELLPIIDSFDARPDQFTIACHGDASDKDDDMQDSFTLTPTAGGPMAWDWDGEYWTPRHDEEEELEDMEEERF